MHPQQGADRSKRSYSYPPTSACLTHSPTHTLTYALTHQLIHTHSHSYSCFRVLEETRCRYPWQGIDGMARHERHHDDRARAGTTELAMRPSCNRHIAATALLCPPFILPFVSPSSVYSLIHPSIHHFVVLPTACTRLQHTQPRTPARDGTCPFLVNSSPRADVRRPHNLCGADIENAHLSAQRAHIRDQPGISIHTSGAGRALSTRLLG